MMRHNQTSSHGCIFLNLSVLLILIQTVFRICLLKIKGVYMRNFFLPPG